MENLYDKIQETAQYIKNKTDFKPEFAIILGSGLGGLTEKIDVHMTFPYSDLPNFPSKMIEGHSGELILGTLNNRPIIAMSGRFHLYQGYDPVLATFPVRVMKAIGAKIMIVTNAAGGLNSDFSVGDLMIITDHVNSQGLNPLCGDNDERLGVRFQPMNDAYSKRLIKLADEIADKEKIKLQRGIYDAQLGPTYETGAEVKKAAMYADAVGMSTVPEVIVARHAGLEVLGISCITNICNDGSHEHSPNHEEVIEAGNMAGEKLQKIILGVIEKA